MAERDQSKTEFGMQDQSNVVVVPPTPAPNWGVVQWMQMPAPIPGCPRGLEYLTQLDQMLVHQQVELLEAFIDIETKNRYQIKNALGQQIYFAYEESEFCMRNCCEGDRGFTMHIVDHTQQEILRLVRQFKCCAGCCWCADCGTAYAHIIGVESPPGQIIGYVRQRGSKWTDHYDILDANMEPVLKIRGPCCFCQEVCCTCDIDFKVMSYDESQQVGKISKQWAGLAKEWYTDADNFGVQFPMDLDVKVKATLLGALFLIDYVVFENSCN